MERRVQFGHPPAGYLARACLRYGASAAEWRVLRVCRRAEALLRRVVAYPLHVSGSVSPINRGRPAWLDVRYSLQSL